MPFAEILVPGLAALVAVAVPLRAWWVRGRTYAIFGAVILAFSLPGALFAWSELREVGPAALVDHGAAVGIAAAGLHLAHLARARMRSRIFRALVSVPGQVLVAGGFLCGVFWLAGWPARALARFLDWPELVYVLEIGVVIPVAIAAVSVLTSIRPRAEVVRITLGADGPSELLRHAHERHPADRAPAHPERPLRIAQVTDPHLGPWQSVRALQRLLDDLLARDPDLILLTGDYLTMESQGTPEALAEALRPLAGRRGDCYAAFGNHDHEAPEIVRRGLAANGVELLVDAEAITETPIGPVQIVGADYVSRERRAHLAALSERYPRRQDHLRFLLLHDPSAFSDTPADDFDLVFSGHTHGGQIGLVSLGLDWTVLSGTRWPDHGLFARGRSRLYVHRGSGFYGFPLRVGVPGEKSVLEVRPGRSLDRRGGMPHASEA